MHNKNYLLYTAKSEADKAISTLKGILQGINIDQIINPIEIAELQTWANEHYHLIRRNPFKELINEINYSINDEGVNSGVIEDLYWLCQKFDNDNIYYNAVTSDIQILHGICHGILADGFITDKEIDGLKSWLNENEHLSSYYPYDEISSLILDITSDGIIDDNERNRLMAYFNDFASIKNEKTKYEILNSIEGTKVSAICTSNPIVEFVGKSFCITGELQRGRRKEVQSKLLEIGCIINENPSMKTDYLVIGDNGNQAWAFACYGRKVEKALELRKKGHNITLIHEYSFFDIMEDEGHWK